MFAGVNFWEIRKLDNKPEQIEMENRKQNKEQRTTPRKIALGEKKLYLEGLRLPCQEEFHVELLSEDKNP